LSVVILLVLAVGARVSLVWSGAIPNEHDDLKMATALRINYTVDGFSRTLTINNPREVQEVLSAMVFTGTSRGGRYRRFYTPPSRGAAPSDVDFLYPGGREIHATFVSRTEMSRNDRGPVQLTPRFYEKISQILSQQEGKKVDPLRFSRY
jgi:hypothetical protein